MKVSLRGSIEPKEGRPDAAAKAGSTWTFVERERNRGRKGKRENLRNLSSRLPTALHI